MQATAWPFELYTVLLVWKVWEQPWHWTIDCNASSCNANLAVVILAFFLSLPRTSCFFLCLCVLLLFFHSTLCVCVLLFFFSHQPMSLLAMNLLVNSSKSKYHVCCCNFSTLRTSSHHRREKNFGVGMKKAICKVWSGHSLERLKAIVKLALLINLFLVALCKIKFNSKQPHFFQSQKVDFLVIRQNAVHAQNTFGKHFVAFANNNCA